MTRHLGQGLLLAITVLFTRSLSAQTSSLPADNCSRRTVVVTVSDQNGPVMNLDKSNFLLESKSLTLNVVAARVRRPAPRAIVVLDLSGSMREPGKLPAISSLARGFLDAAPSRAPLALLTFADRVKDRLDFSGPREAIVHRLEEISREPDQTHGGMTALFDALNEAIPMFGVPQTGDVIFLISDGGDNRSHTHARKIRRLLLEHGIRLFSFIPFEMAFPMEDVELGLESLVSLSHIAGGRSMTLEELSRGGGWDNSPEALARDREMGKYMYVLAASSYELDVELDRVIQKSPLKLKIVGPEGKELHNVQSLYPHELMPCLQLEHR
ncbi:MAG: vWA domain-containing protein [Terriglobales bacterium]